MKTRIPPSLTSEAIRMHGNRKREKSFCGDRADGPGWSHETNWEGRSNGLIRLTRTDAACGLKPEGSMAAVVLNVQTTAPIHDGGTVPPLAPGYDRGTGKPPARSTVILIRTDPRCPFQGVQNLIGFLGNTMDNSQNANSFRYLADGELVELAAGMSRTHRGRFPVAVEFDRGDGRPAEMMLPSGTFRIVIDAETQLWKLEVIPEAAEM